VPQRSGSEVLSVECPEIIEDYNAFMGGVDISDQYMFYYSVWCHIDLVIYFDTLIKMSCNFPLFEGIAM